MESIQPNERDGVQSHISDRSSYRLSSYQQREANTSLGVVSLFDILKRNTKLSMYY